MNARERLAAYVGADLLGLVDAYVDERIAGALAAQPPPVDANGSGWLTIAAAADLLGCSPDAVRMRVKRGRLEARHEGRRVYVSRRSVSPPLGEQA